MIHDPINTSRMQHFKTGFNQTTCNTKIVNPLLHCMALMRALSPVRVTCLDAFATLTAALVDVLPCLVGSHEGDGLDVRVIADAVHCVMRPMHDAAHQSRAT